MRVPPHKQAKKIPAQPVSFFRVLSQDNEMYRATRLKAEMNEETV
jgi:hypothetical protein